MVGQVAAQGFGDGLAALVAQRMQAGRAQGHQRAKVGAAFLHHAQACITEPFMAAQRLFEHGQGDTLFFQFDNPVQAAAQGEATIGLDFHGIGSLFAMAGWQVGRRQVQRTFGVLSQLDPGKRRPQFAALTPGNAAGFRTAVDFRGPLAKQAVQFGSGFSWQRAARGKHLTHCTQLRPVEVIAHSF